MKQYKVKIANWLLKNLFNTITEEDILRFANGKFLRGNVEVDPRAAASLATQAKSILRSPLWDYLMKDLQYIANKKIYDNLVTVEDAIFGKAMLYNLDIINRKMQRLSMLKLTDKEKEKNSKRKIIDKKPN